MRYSLIISEDNTHVREGLVSLIDWNRLGFQVTGLFEDGRQVKEFLTEGHADVVLTDIRMSIVSGLELAEWISANKPKIAVVLISAYREFEYARKAIQFHVSHYLLKPLDLEEVIEVFRKIKEELDIREANKNRNETYDLDIVGRAREFILANLMNDLSLERVSGHVGLCPAYFSRIFKERTGMNYIKFVKEHKIEKAKDLLAHSDYHVYEICALLRYNDANYFTNLFREHTGMSPAEFRKTAREDGTA